MRRKLSVLLLFCFMTASAGEISSVDRKQKFEDPWFAADKWKHFSFSLMTTVQVGGLSGMYSENDTAPAAAFFVVGLGVGKEIRDKKAYGLFSYKDLTFDIGGAVLGMILVKQLQAKGN